MDNKCQIETLSRCVTTTASATHNFEVTDFSLLEGMGAGKYVSSRTFSAGGRDWNIRVYPDGWKGADRGAYVSVFLCVVSGLRGASSRAKYTLSLLQRDGSVSNSVELSHTFRSADSYWGINEFAEKSELKPLLSHDGGDSFTIRCVLTVIVESQSEGLIGATMAAPPPPSDIHKHLERMLKEGKGMDVTFDVDGQLFHAHRCVLAARSPVFEAELFGPMKERAAEPIRVAKMEPSVFEELLHFVYTDSMSSDKGSADEDDAAATKHLLVAADGYGLDRLKLMCEVKLCHGIEIQTVASSLVLAEQHHCVHLKDACLRFIASRYVLGAVMKTDGFKQLVATCPFVAVEILDKVKDPCP